MTNVDFLDIVEILPAVINGLTIHEFAHAYTAYLCGYHTSKDLGRLTLNPIKHIDPLRIHFIILAGFGGAKPVTLDEYKPKNK